MPGSVRCSRPCTTGDWVTGLRPIHRESRCSVPVRARSALSGASGATGRSGTPWTSNFQASWACRSATLFPCSRTLGGPMFRRVHEVICSVCRECDGGSSGESPDGRTRLAVSERSQASTSPSPSLSGFVADAANAAVVHGLSQPLLSHRCARAAVWLGCEACC